jgi:formylglycine-generating enzyme required for sulfatase activity
VYDAIRGERRLIWVTTLPFSAVALIAAFALLTGLYAPEVVVDNAAGYGVDHNEHTGEAEIRVRNTGIASITMDGPATIDLPGVVAETATKRPISGRRLSDLLLQTDASYNSLFRGTQGELTVRLTATSCEALNSHIENLRGATRRQVYLVAHLTVPVRTWIGVKNLPLNDPVDFASEGIGKMAANVCDIDLDRLPQKTPALLPPDQVVGEFVPIPPGTFTMGPTPNPVVIRANLGFSTRAMNERKVTITKQFEMARYEVTQAQWYTVMGTIPSYFAGDNSPVENVTWEDAQKFLEKLNARNDGYLYRLPTEAEWEYAARAGSTAEPDLDAVAWHRGNSQIRTHPVGTKQPNAWGLYDMVGNVAEWVQDWWDWLPTTPETDPQGPAEIPGSIDVKIERGGSFNDGLPLVSVSYRMRRSAPFGTSTVTGFRCVRERVVP